MRFVVEPILFVDLEVVFFISIIFEIKEVNFHKESAVILDFATF